jgi:hypothetical protein
VKRLAAVALAAALLSGCDMAERLTGTDPVAQVGRDNPVDPGSVRPIVLAVTPGETPVVEPPPPGPPAVPATGGRFLPHPGILRSGVLGPGG